MTKTVYKKDLLFPELSYSIVGCAYEVFNELGGGHKEKIYQTALAHSFHSKQLNYQEQIYYPLYFKDKLVGKGYWDYLIDKKIIVKIKALSFFAKTHIDQVLNYLHTSNLKLALLISFGQNEVRVKRIVNFKTE